MTLVKRDWSGEQVNVQKKCLKFWLQAGQPTRKIPAVCICNRNGAACQLEMSHVVDCHYRRDISRIWPH